jgi:PhoPQ-activated pathogenicity-related protein
MSRTRLSILLFPLLLAAQPAAKVPYKSGETALDRYVRKPDSSFQYKLVNTIPGSGVTTYVLEMTSQHYLTEGEVNTPVWMHNLVIVKPDTVTSSKALMFISGGSIPLKAPTSADAFYMDVARTTGTVVAEIRQIPNEPVIMAGETKKRSEDGIIAYTWRKFMETGDEKWPLRLPMTKASVRAMDAITGFLASAEGGKVKVDQYVVSGGSKRGWTTWTTAAVDKRVIAIAPVVIDVLNMAVSMTHHFRVYGFYAPSVGDYVSEGIMDWPGTKQYEELMKIEEPYEYRDRFTMPKFIVNSAGDQFFVVDSSQFYWNDLVGEKHLRYVPNTDHGVTRRSDAAISLAAFYESVVKNTPRPTYSWRFLPGGVIEWRTKDKPKSVKMWSANNPNARDFRLETLGPQYKSVDLTDQGNGVYRVTPPAAERGYTAYFIEAAYPGAGKYEMKFTSGVRVTPDKYPFEVPKPVPPPGAILLKGK